VTTLAFDIRQPNLFGTTVATFDYADAAERILGHRPVILYDASGHAAAGPALDRFRARFATLPYRSLEELRRVIEGERAELYYCPKEGPNDGRIIPDVRNAFHVVFQHYEPHGDVYAYVSRWLADRMTAGRCPWVPHVVDLPPPNRDLRQDWNIPADAVVLGRHGAYRAFNLPFVPQTIAAALDRRRDLHFVFVNTAPVITHERVHHLPAIQDRGELANFIAACDAMLHARRQGESFGLAIAEFLSLGKPVLSWAGGLYANHVELIPERRHLYRTSRELLRLLLEIGPDPDVARYRNAVAAYRPEAVMARFAQVFIAGATAPAGFRPLPPWVRARSSLARKSRAMRRHYWLWRSRRE
jgi:hypothetical protein